jgi:asparagine synthase (glutamine-hydrolysing)
MNSIMCGIFSLLNNCNTFDNGFVDQQFQKGKARGPEFSKLSQVGLKISMGFHRLSINGLNVESNQPLVDGDITLICNGEIYNYKELYKYMDIKPKTDSDCEVIIHLYKKYGIDHTLQMLDGVFSFILLDNNVYNENFKMYVARDPYGVRPLYILHPNKHLHANKKKYNEYEYIIGFASELKVLYPFYSVLDNLYNNNKSIDNSFPYTLTDYNNHNNTKSKYTLDQFPPGSYSYYTLSSKVLSVWKLETEYRRYHSTGFNSIMYHNSPQYYEADIILNIQRYLLRAVEKRCSTTERPIACLLSGGLDSSIITGLVNQYCITHEMPILETYSIGLEGSVDLKYAKMVADHLKTKHTEIVLTEADFLEAIPEVICAIESYDTTTVRASIGNYLIGKYISRNSKAKVIFNGDGADELCGGYLYMNLAGNAVEFDCESRQLLRNIYLYDVLRSDKCISSHGLEPRTPFLDRAFVQYYLSIPPQLRFHTANDQCEKYLIRQAFSKEHYRTNEDNWLLPTEVIWRKKEAFSDGVSHQTRSLYQIIQEYADRVIPDIQTITEDDIMKNVGNHLIPTTSEQYMYRRIFETNYSGMGKIIPRFWMPKYADHITDPSARTLDIYVANEDDQDK